MRNFSLMFGALATLLFALTLPADAQNWRTMTSARQLQGGDPVDARIQYGAGTLTITPGEAPYLYRMELRYDQERTRPMAEYDSDDRVLHLGSDSEEFGRRGIDASGESSATIQLTRQVPLDLDVKFGAGKADIELGGISLERLHLGTGASETTVRFSSVNPIEAERVQIEAGAAELRVYGLGNARAERIAFKGGVGSTILDFGGAGGNTDVRIEMGVGSLVLRLPRGHGVRMERDSFLTSFTAPGMTRDGDAYVTSNWDSAQQKIDIELSAALGSVDIEWID